MLILVLYIIRRTIVVLAIIALVASILLEMIPVYTNGVNQVANAIHITNQQSALAERISKDALTLALPGDHSTAILELQVSLPVFEKNQAGLQANDPSLQLPQRTPGDIALLLVQAQSDYVALDSAAQSILKNADAPIDANQLAIIQQHERPYFIAMNIVSKTWQQRIIANALAFFQLELGFGIGLLALVIVYWILGRIIHSLGKRQKEDKHEVTTR